MFLVEWQKKTAIASWLSSAPRSYGWLSRRQMMRLFDTQTLMVFVEKLLAINLLLLFLDLMDELDIGTAARILKVVEPEVNEFLVV